MISVEKLHKSYGATEAVKGVSFEVARGEVVGFLGPNGAGKSTTLRIVAGFLGATSGRVTIDGFDIVQQPLETRRRIGYMPENVPLYPELRVREYLTHRAELKSVPRARRTAAVQKAMDDLRLADHAEVIIGKLSKGYRQRVGLADALVASPPVLVLDEPTSGLDPNQIREVRDLIRSLASDHTILLSTHILSEVEATCDRALVIDRGRLVAHGSLEELGRMRQSGSTRFVVRGNTELVSDILNALPHADRVKLRNATPDGLATIDVIWKGTAEEVASSVERGIAALVAAELPVREVTARKATLEEVFAALTVEEPAPPRGEEAA